MTKHVPTAPGLFQTLTGRTGADISGDQNASVRGQLIAAFGPSRRDPGRPNTRAAAKSLGVSQRTVERWLAREDQQHTTPRAETMKKISTRARQASTTKRGRERAVRQARDTGAAPVGGMRVSITGDQGPEKQYARYRTTRFDLNDPVMAEGFMQAYVDGGDDGARAYLREHADSAYGMDRWHFGSLDSLSVEGPYGR